VSPVRFFRVAERGTTVRREILGGVTTFVTMAYIIVVNPAILAFAGIPRGPSTVATILAAVFGCLAMGLYANLPIGVAPYMGENAFIAFGLTALGISWQQRLGAVFVSGLAFGAITLLRIRSWLARAVSTSLKHAFAVGIGLFLAFIGLYETGIVRSFVAGMPAAALSDPGGRLRNPDVPVRIGNLREPRSLLAIAGFLLIAVLLSRRVRGAILIGIAVVAAAGVALGQAPAPSALAAWPGDAIAGLSEIAGKLDVAAVLRISFLPILLTLFLMSFLDTLGTLVGVGAAGDLLDREGNFPDIEKPMMVDATACVASSLLGTSTSGAFIESAAGIREGARTGLASVTTAALFAGSLFFLPLVAPLQELRFAYGPALVAVGLLMTASAAKIDYADFTEVVPAFTAIAVMIFTYNIANGLTASLVVHPLLKAGTGRIREVPAGGWVLAAMCLVYFVFGIPH
jgi:AGZA family xanthine/uracil permease-like MFS transporter